MGVGGGFLDDVVALTARMAAQRWEDNHGKGPLLMVTTAMQAISAIVDTVENIMMVGGIG